MDCGEEINCGEEEFFCVPSIMRFLLINEGEVVFDSDLIGSSFFIPTFDSYLIVSDSNLI